MSFGSLKLGLRKHAMEGNQQERPQRVQVVQGAGSNVPPVMIPLAKQVLKISRQVAVLRAMTLHFYMLDKSQPWIEPMQQAHQQHVAAQQLAQEGEKWKMDPIQVVIWQAMIKAMHQAIKDTKQEGMNTEDSQQVQRIFKEFEDFTKEGMRKIGNEVMHLQLKPAFRQEKIKLEAMMMPNCPSGSLWTNIVCPLLILEGGYIQKGVEPKGDLERKIQNWMDVTVPNQRQQD